MVSRLVYLLVILLSFYQNVVGQNTSNTDREITIWVIGNTTSNESFTAQDLREILLGQRIGWANGNKMYLVLPNTKEPKFEPLIETITGKSKNEFMKHWLSLVFGGRNSPPKYASNVVSVEDLLADQMDSISFSLAEPSNQKLILQKVIIQSKN